MPQQNNELDKFNRTLFRQLYACLHLQNLLATEIKEASTECPGRIDELLALTGSWGKYYELSLLELISEYISLDEPANETFLACERANTPNSALLIKTFNEPPVDMQHDQVDPKSLAVSLAVSGNLKGIKVFGLTISKMVSKAATGDDESLFKAVFIDCAATQAGAIARRICRAQLSDDDEFMGSLAKAITHTKPRRPLEKHDDLRIILVLLEELYGLDNISDDDLAGLVIDDLQLYPDDTADPLAGLMDHVRKIKALSRK